MALTSSKAEKAVPRKAAYYIADRDGLYLWVRPTGAKAWYARTRRAEGKGMSWKKLADRPETSLEDAGKAKTDEKSVYRLNAHVYLLIGDIPVRELSKGYAT